MANTKLNREYYNKDIKERYLAERTDVKTETRQNSERIFSKTIPFEEENSKDVCNFSIREIQDMMKRLSFTSSYGAIVFRSQLFMYTQWAIGENLVDSCINYYDPIYLEKPEEYVDVNKVRKKIITREELLLAISKLANPSDQYAILAIFEGIDGENRKEIMDLRTTDIDVKKKIAHLSTGRSVKVSDKLIDLAFESANTDKFYALTGRVLPFQEDATLIFKNFRNNREESTEINKGRRVYFRLKKALGAIDLEDWSLPSIRTSGIIHLINETAKEQNKSSEELLYMPEMLELIKTQYDQEFFCKRRAFLQQFEEYLV